MNDQNKTAADIFGPVLYTYSRSQAVADGLQVEVSKVAEEAGIRFPVFLTRAVYDSFVRVPPGVTGQDEAGRLWDVIPSAELCRVDAISGVPLAAMALISLIQLGIITGVSRRPTDGHPVGSVQPLRLQVQSWRAPVPSTLYRRAGILAPYSTFRDRAKVQ